MSDYTPDDEIEIEIDESITTIVSKHTERETVLLTGDMKTDTDALLDTISRGNTNGHPSLFVTAGNVTRLGTNDDGIPMIANHSSSSFSYWTSQYTRWQKTGRRRGEIVNCPPPAGSVHALMDMADTLTSVPKLERVVQVPFYTRSRTLAATEGYHASSRTWYQPSQSFDVPSLNPSPSSSQLKSALSLIMDDLLVDFPFASQGDRAGAVALLLEPFVKDMIQGSTPLHLIEAATQGTGKTKLAKNCLSIGMGCRPSDVPGKALSHDEAEIRKSITTDLMAGSPVIFYDNVSHALRSSSLANALTSSTWSDRVLGASENAEMKIRCSWVMTSNNASYDKDTARRISLIRLDMSTLGNVDASVKESPETRDGFKHPNLEGWVQDHQGRLVWAALTLVQNWLAEGGKPWSGKPLGSFESWSMVMGGILEAAGIDGFLSNRDQIEASTGESREDVLTFLEAWDTKHKDNDVLPSDLATMNQSQENPIGLKPDKSGGFSNPMGYWLRKHKDCVIGGYQICQSTINKRKWQLHQV